MDVCVKLLADDVGTAEYDENAFLSVNIDSFDQLFLNIYQIPCLWCKLVP